MKIVFFFSVDLGQPISGDDGWLTWQTKWRKLGRQDQSSTWSIDMEGFDFLARSWAWTSVSEAHGALTGGTPSPRSRSDDQIQSFELFFFLVKKRPQTSKKKLGFFIELIRVKSRVFTCHRFDQPSHAKSHNYDVKRALLKSSRKKFNFNWKAN
jgi:hypothetical protein